jgi:hypothetical protein
MSAPAGVRAALQSLEGKINRGRSNLQRLQ